MQLQYQQVRNFKDNTHTPTKSIHQITSERL